MKYLGLSVDEFNHTKCEVMGLLIARGSTPEDAEDAFQEAALRIWEYYGKGSCTQGLLREISKQRYITMTRTLYARNEIPGLDPAQFRTNNGIEMLEWRDYRMWQYRELNRLYAPVVLRVMRLYYRFGQRALARRFRCSPSTVRHAIFRMRKRQLCYLPPAWIEVNRRKRPCLNL